MNRIKVNKDLVDAILSESWEPILNSMPMQLTQSTMRRVRSMYPELSGPGYAQIEREVLTMLLENVQHIEGVTGQLVEYMNRKKIKFESLDSIKPKGNKPLSLEQRTKFEAGLVNAAMMHVFIDDLMKVDLFPLIDQMIKKAPKSAVSTSGPTAKELEAAVKKGADSLLKVLEKNMDGMKRTIDGHTTKLKELTALKTKVTNLEKKVAALQKKK